MNFRKPLGQNWKPITTLVVNGIITGIIIPLFFTTIQPELLNPQFHVSDTQVMRFGCEGLPNDMYSQQCPNNTKPIQVFQDELTIQNTGNKQAKNVNAIIEIKNPVWHQNDDCLEGNITKTDDTQLSISFKRFSQNISCLITLENTRNYAINRVIITADDAPGYLEPGSSIVTQYWEGSLFVTLFVLGYFGLVVYMLYRLVLSFLSILNQKRLKIPSKAKAYSCDVRFEELENGTTELSIVTESTKKVIEQRNNWFERINTIAETKISNISLLNAKDEVSVQVPGGIVHIKIGEITIQYYGTNYRAVNLSIRSENRKAIEKLIEAGKYPCWTFYWDLESEIDVKTLVDKIFKKTGKTPSESGTSQDKGIVTMQANYDVSIPNIVSFRIFLNDKSEHQNGRIGMIIHQGHPSAGFYRLKFLSMSSLLLLLYDEISVKRFAKRIEKVYFNSKQS